MSKNLRGLSARKGLEEGLFSAIKKAGPFLHGENGTLLAELSGKYLVGKSSLLSASSFYDFLRSDHAGKKVFTCEGTACLTSGNT
jgi:NADH-quinone oxidoreductase subunit F